MPSKNVLGIDGNQLLLDNKPFRLVGGAIHYARVPHEYWKDRLQKLLDMGCNTIESYIFWNAHEPYPGQYDFSGMLDLVKFVELAGEMGLHVILRPGPYCCAEWDMGGIPWWVLNEPGVAVRCNNPVWMKLVEKWFAKLLPMIAPLQSTRGGPVIAVQIENEYGYYGNDQEYLQNLRDLNRNLGIDVQLFTSDGAWQQLTLLNGGLDDLLRTANFGSGAKDRFETLEKVQPGGPKICMEFWSGWFDTWRTPNHITRSAGDYAKELDELLTENGQLVFYMFQGGTNWGFTAGGNLSDDFKPFVTSYDYDALLSETGDITEKYRLCRDVLYQHLKLNQEKKEFAPTKAKAYGLIQLNKVVSLVDSIKQVSKKVESAEPLTMEALGHGRGFVLYRTILPKHYRGENLVIRGMHDWCNVLLNGKSVATWYRNDPQPTIKLDFDTDHLTLEILVHNLARSNFGPQMVERKGIAQGVHVGGKLHDERILFGWENYSLPIEDLSNLKFENRNSEAGPGFYKGSLKVEGNPQDTFIKLPGFDLGCVVVNGFNIGRYWNVGPQKTLYLPAPFLKSGENEIILFEAVKAGEAIVSTDMHDIG